MGGGAGRGLGREGTRREQALEWAGLEIGATVWAGPEGTGPGKVSLSLCLWLAVWLLLCPRRFVFVCLFALLT